jgi:endogenous inhibitor of DNA gyrase (YacG/DUF329 family)
MRDENGDSGDAPSGGGTDATEEHCSQCGQPIDTSDWYPVTTRRNEDGTRRFFSFCSQACQSAWLDEED